MTGDVLWKQETCSLIFQNSKCLVDVTENIWKQFEEAEILE